MECDKAGGRFHEVGSNIEAPRRGDAGIIIGGSCGLQACSPETIQILRNKNTSGPDEFLLIVIANGDKSRRPASGGRLDSATRYSQASWSPVRATGPVPLDLHLGPLSLRNLSGPRWSLSPPSLDQEGTSTSCRSFISRSNTCHSQQPRFHLRISLHQRQSQVTLRIHKRTGRNLERWER